MTFCILRKEKLTFWGGMHIQIAIDVIYIMGHLYYSIQIYHVWEGYLRKIPVETKIFPSRMVSISGDYISIKD